MACLYAIEAYAPAAVDLEAAAKEALDEVDRIDRLMSHYKADSPLSEINNEAGTHPVQPPRERMEPKDATIHPREELDERIPSRDVRAFVGHHGTCEANRPGPPFNRKDDHRCEHAGNDWCTHARRLHGP